MGTVVLQAPTLDQIVVDAGDFGGGEDEKHNEEDDRDVVRDYFRSNAHCTKGATNGSVTLTLSNSAQVCPLLLSIKHLIAMFDQLRMLILRRRRRHRTRLSEWRSATSQSSLACVLSTL